MKKIQFLLAIIMVVMLLPVSCTNQTKESDEPAKIENTLQSVSYFNDTVGLDPQVLLKTFTLLNEAIDEIGYPDAGYELWVNQSETSDVRFMVEGLWPDQETYNIIHDHQLYIDAGTADSTLWDKLGRVNYFRFSKVK